MKSKNSLIALAVLSLFTGCGGGGGGVVGDSVSTAPTPNQIANFGVNTSTPSTTSTTTSTTILPAPSYVTSVPDPNYAQGSQELDVFNLLNKERLACGFGALRQNSKLDTAAKGQSDWNLNSGYHLSHNQIPGTNGFTGEFGIDRFDAVGYVYGQIVENVVKVSANTTTTTSFAAITEVLSSIYDYNTSNSMGVTRLRGLLNSPYHLMGLISGFVDVGIGYSASSDIKNNNPTTPYTVLAINLGTPYNLYQSAASNDTVRTYPCEGTVGVENQMDGESPSPTPGRDLFENPIGSSIAVTIDYNHALTITNASIVNIENNTRESVLTPVTSLTDVNKRLFKNEGFIMADKPLLPNTKYRVTINGTDDGKAFYKEFTYTTGISL